MADDDVSGVVALGQYVLGALALVAVTAGVFWAIGAVRSDDSGGQPTVAGAPTGDEAASPDDADDADDAGAPTTPAATPTAAPSPSPAPSPDQPDPSASVAPAEISVQVLDAVIDDEGAAAAELADRLRADGYDLVAENRAVRRYEQTTVFFTPGSEAAARQIAARYGFAVVEPKPDNLTDQVDVHLVVGADAT